MKPLPVERPHLAKPGDDPVAGLPSLISTAAGRYSTANRRSSSWTLQKSYPWMLCGSTLLAAVFCVLYLTKPVVVTAAVGADRGLPSATDPTDPTDPTDRTDPGSDPVLLPNADRLPGESVSPVIGKTASAEPRPELLDPAAATGFEETNLRIQHVLNAEAPGGHQDRIDLEVPVLYQSRQLRWTADQVAGARELMIRLMDHQEKTRQLRDEGAALLDTWNRLVAHSIPATGLRADSPTLPANQDDAADTPRPAGWTTTESVEIQTSEP